MLAFFKPTAHNAASRSTLLLFGRRTPGPVIHVVSTPALTSRRLSEADIPVFFPITVFIPYILRGFPRFVKYHPLFSLTELKGIAGKSTGNAFFIRF